MFVNVSQFWPLGTCICATKKQHGTIRRNQPSTLPSGCGNGGVVCSLLAAGPVQYVTFGLRKWPVRYVVSTLFVPVCLCQWWRDYEAQKLEDRRQGSLDRLDEAGQVLRCSSLFWSHALVATITFRYTLFCSVLIDYVAFCFLSLSPPSTLTLFCHPKSWSACLFALARLWNDCVLLVTIPVLRSCGYRLSIADTDKGSDSQ